MIQYTYDIYNQILQHINNSGWQIKHLKTKRDSQNIDKISLYL